MWCGKPYVSVREILLAHKILHCNKKSKKNHNIPNEAKQRFFIMESLVHGDRSEFNGFAGKRGFSVQVSVFCFSFLTPETPKSGRSGQDSLLVG